MIVFANRRLGPATELLVSPAVASAMLRATAEAARPAAEARWEHELVRWLEGWEGRLAVGGDLVPGPAPEGERADRADRPWPRGPARVIDVSDIAWTPDNFDRQRRFLLGAIEQAGAASEHSRPLGLWARMIAAHPRDSVQFGRRWTWQPSA